MVKALLFFFVRKIFREEVNEVAVIYATLIVKGKKTFDQVPERIQAQVKEILSDLDVPELAE
ncbi:hypothetical protein GN277_07165 [Lachnospiraceae bacterium WCA-9-b2]|uniref:Uncharacterized protein n=1 Tax=Sporofaciens musculi TaxID=2681861 RepID=A0A7X3MF61_9FIRM|nr:CD1375 family protein [Sporofaciens musculi]MXP75170.1 hypothetical protein [Sporofaciens musculi]